MVSDSDLINRLREILRTSDLNTTTPGAVRRQLESDFGEDLTDRKKFISQQIDEIIQTADGNDGEDENAAEEDGGDGEEAAEDVEDDGNEAAEEVEEEEEEDDEEVEKSAQDEDTKKKRKGSGFTKLCSISPQLQEFVGVPEIARTEVVKKLWAYIKEKDLQDPNNRRNIKCDKMLRSIFRVDTINMFQMNKVLSKHIWPLESEVVTQPPEKKQKRQKDEDKEKSKPEAKQKKGGTTGFLLPLQLSEAFVKFLGTGETTLCRSEAVKRIWDYIKQNQLQDPSDKRRILCDEKLKELFDVDTFNGFSVSKYLTAHLTKVGQ